MPSLGCVITTTTGNETTMTRRRRTRAALAALLGAALLGVSPPATAAPSPVPVIGTVETTGDPTQTLLVSWDHIGVPLSSYEIHYRTGTDGTWRWSSSGTVGAGHGSWIPYVEGQDAYTHEFRIPNATANTTYQIGIKALDPAGTPSSIGGTEVTVTTAPPPGEVTASSTAPGEATVSWPAYDATPFLRYDVSLTEDSGTTPHTARVTDPRATSHTFTGLVPGATYTAEVRVSQTVNDSGPTPTGWVRSAPRTATVTVAAPTELFFSTPEHPFVDAATGTPATINGVNVKRPVYIDVNNGKWATASMIKEIQALGRTGAPDFDTVRITMDWPYFQQATRSQDGTYTAPTFNAEAFAELDKVVRAAKDAGLYVVLDPIHSVTTSDSICKEPAMVGAHRAIPAWAWAKVGIDPGTTCENGVGRTYMDKTDDALALPETAAYLREVVTRYSPEAQTTEDRKALAHQVIAIDLVNEPHSSDERGVAAGLPRGSATAQMQHLVETVYGPWLGDGPNSVRVADPDKILLVQPIAGSGSLQGVDLTPVAKPNVVMSLHDYVGRYLSETDRGFGRGYSAYGFADGSAVELTDNREQGKLAYTPAVAPYTERAAQHTDFLQQFTGWSADAGMPVLIGEYGIVSSCKKGSQADVDRYAQDTYGIYEDLGLSRILWTHGSWDDMAIWFRGPGTCLGYDIAKEDYLPHAFEYTGGARR